MFRWLSVTATAALLLLSTAAPAQMPGFSRNEVQVFADRRQFSQILYYNYTTQQAEVEGADDGDNFFERPIQRLGYVSYWLYDYEEGRYTESVLVGHSVF